MKEPCLWVNQYSSHVTCHFGLIQPIRGQSALRAEDCFAGFYAPTPANVATFDPSKRHPDGQTGLRIPAPLTRAKRCAKALPPFCPCWVPGSDLKIIAMPIIP